MHNSKITSQKAFTLVELSIVLVIIGLLLGLINVGINLMNQAKVRAARAITSNSPVWEIFNSNLEMSAVLWYDVLDTKLLKRDSDNFVTSIRSKIGDPDRTTMTISNEPIYQKDGMADFPTISFDDDTGTSDSLSRSFTLNDNFSVAIVFLPTVAQAADATFLEVNTLDLRANSDETISFDNGIGEAGTYSYKVNDMNLVIVTSDASSGPTNVAMNYYVNQEGPAGNSGDPSTQFAGVRFGDITNNFEGKISEIIIFDKPLSSREIDTVTEYFYEKYKLD